MTNDDEWHLDVGDIGIVEYQGAVEFSATAMFLGSCDEEFAIWDFKHGQLVVSHRLLISAFNVLARIADVEDADKED